MQNKQTRIHIAYHRSFLKYLCTFFLFTLCLIQSVYGQKNKADSLRIELAEHIHADTNRVKLLILMSSSFYHISSDSQLKYAAEALEIAQKLPYNKLISNAQHQVGASYYASNSTDSALYYYQSSLEICRKQGYNDLMAARFNSLGNIFLRLSDFVTALSYYDSSLKYAEDNNDLTNMARARSNIATVYYEQGSYSAALKNYIETLSIHEQLGNISDIEASILNLSNVYFRLRDYEKAKQYAQRASEIINLSDSKYNSISCYTTIAMIHNKQKQYDSSLYYLQAAYDAAVPLNNSYIINLLKGNLAECYFNKGNFAKANQLYAESLTKSNELNDVEGVAVAKAGLGQIMVKQGKTQMGLTYLQEGFQLMEDSKMFEQALEISDIIANTYEGLNDYKNAFKYTKLSNSFKDTLDKEDALKSARTLEFEYILDKKESQILLLQKDKNLELSKLKSQRILTISAVICFLLVSLIALLVFRNLKQAKQNNQLILQQKEEIEIQAKELQEMNNFKDVTFSVLSHDLRSPINALTGTMAMLDEGIITPEEFTQHKNELNNKLQSVNLMLDNLLQWAKSQMKGEHTLDIERINIRRKTLRTFAVLKDAAIQKNIILATDIKDDLFVHADRNQLAMVLRNLVSNAIKFTPNGGTVSVDAEQADNTIQIKVTDTGVGMSAEQIARLFDGKPNESTDGTVGEKGTGIGLQLSYNFIANHGGDITVCSTPNNGSTFTISLPA